MNNPLLSEKPLPLFNEILPLHVAPAIEEILDANRKQIQALLDKQKNVASYTWETLVEPLNRLENHLNNVWSTVSHLSSVMDSPELRVAHDAMLLKITEYYTELGQNEDLYQAFLSLDKQTSVLNPIQQKIIRDELRDFRLSGVHLNPEQKIIFKQLKTKLSDLESQFEHHVLDATHGFHLHITDLERLRGIPTDALHLAKQSAIKRNLSGWALTLDYATYHAVQCYAEHRELRETLYYAYVTRASDLGPDANKWNNDPVMSEMLVLRQQLANLLGFKDFREYSVHTKMAKVPSKVSQFLWELVNRASSRAKLEFAELKQFALEKYQLENVSPWDIGFLSEKLRQLKYQISEEQLKAYFPIHKVLEGLFNLVQTLFGIRIEECFNFQKWHETVRLFTVHDKQGTLRGQFFLDLYARENKREGAWVADCRTRVKWRDGSIQTPVAYVTTNIAPAVNDQPALLRHDDVITLFHEFGHCLHHILTTVDYYDVSGHHGVEWDAIELPSQLMENWCWERETLNLMTEHVRTQESLAEDLFQRLTASRHFLAGLFVMRQLEFALVDFELHTEHPNINPMVIQNVVDTIRKQVAVVSAPNYNRFQHAFSHIFAGGYAAGYYSYLWAEVLSSDVYEKFKEEGVLNTHTGQEYLSTILEQGGSKDMMDLFVDFRGREPTVDALLRQLGLNI